MSTKKTFYKYVFQNILGMIGNSLYILADTFFISVAGGANGITALNLVLPIYSLIFAVGSMIGVGSAIRFKILRAQKVKEAEFYFSNAFMFILLLGSIGVLTGLSMPDKIVAFLGGDEQILKIAVPYTRIFMTFTPFFMLNYLFQAFVRNDNAPALAMFATLSSSLFNIVMDYILMFPCGLGMKGAALATGISPVLGVLVCSIHFFSKQNTIRFKRRVPSLKLLLQACTLGISAFIGEISSGVTMLVFNMLILKLAGNVGVAAYGIVANTALVGVAVFNGVAQGAQPLFSEYYGKGNQTAVKQVFRYSVKTTFAFAALIVACVWYFAPDIVAIFNAEQAKELSEHAIVGLKIYFTGFLFAGFNIVGTGYFSAIEAAKWAFYISVLRGFVCIVICAEVLAHLFGMQGIWSAFPAAEGICAAVTLLAICKIKNKIR